MADSVPVKKRQSKPSRTLALAEAVESLSKTALFAPFTHEELEFLASRCERLTYTSGQTIFEPNSPASCLYIVVSGSALIYAAEDQSLIAEYVRGDSFGELELFTRANHGERAIAEGLTTLLAFPSGGKTLARALSDRSALAARLLRNFMLAVSRRTRTANALIKENSPWIRELRRQVYGDKLTGLYNQAYLREQALKDVGTPLALIMLKPDNFKEINDRFGHEAGDACLVVMARELERLTPRGCTLVRYAGNEMGFVCPGYGREEARAFAEQLQQALAGIDLFPVLGSPIQAAAPGQSADLRLQTSFGIALAPAHGSTSAALIGACEHLPLTARSRGGSLILFPEDA